LRMTGKMPVPPTIPKERRLLRSARNDRLWPPRCLVATGFRAGWMGL
jgi:hypothetical protein